MRNKSLLFKISNAIVFYVLRKPELNFINRFNISKVIWSLLKLHWIKSPRSLQFCRILNNFRKLLKANKYFFPSLFMYLISFRSKNSPRKYALLPLYLPISRRMAGTPRANISSSKNKVYPEGNLDLRIGTMLYDSHNPLILKGMHCVLVKFVFLNEFRGWIVVDKCIRIYYCLWSLELNDEKIN